VESIDTVDDRALEIPVDAVPVEPKLLDFPYDDDVEEPFISA